MARSAPLAAALAVALATSISELFRAALSTGDIALLHLTAVAAVGTLYGVRPALGASVASAASMSFFAAQRFSLHAQLPSYWLTLVCFAATALVTGVLAGRFRRRLVETRALAARNERLYETSQRLAGATSVEQVVAVLRDAVRAAFGGDCVVVQPDGRELGVRREPGAAPLSGEDLRLLRALSQLADVALDRQRLADKMRAAQMLTETEKLRAALLSSVSHDLRTPLASIIGAASTLDELGEALPSHDQRELLDTVLSEAARLDRFVDNLLDMTRIEYGGLKPRPSWSDLRDVIAHAARGLTSVLGGRSLQVSVADDLPLLYIDAVLLERVLENLLDNAAKYSPADTPLEITAAVEAGRAVIRLIDRGPGIPGHEREAVFTLFHRAREADQRAAGTGLGLAICRGLVAAIGGELALLDGPDGKGLCAEIRLPLREPLAGAQEP